MSVPTTTDISVKRKVKDGWYVYTCDQLPGLYVAHVDDRVAYNDVPRSVEVILKLNFGMDCKVSHKVSYKEFVRLSGTGGARGVLEERTQELIDSSAAQYFEFTLHQVAHLNR